MTVPARRCPRLPRPQRLGQDDDDPDAARPRARPTRAPRRSSGERGADDLPQVIDRVGAIVESPKFFPAFTGRQNLRLLADAIGTPAPPRRRGPRGDASRGPRPRPLRRLLARHEAAPRHRGDAAQGPGPAHLRRADQRPRPGGHPRGARHDAHPWRARARPCSSARTSSPRSSRSPTPCRSSGTGRCSPRGAVSDILGGASARRRSASASPRPDRADDVLATAGLRVHPRRRAPPRDRCGGPGRDHAGPRRPRPLRQRAHADPRRTSSPPSSSLTADEGLGSEADRDAGGLATGGAA